MAARRHVAQLNKPVGVTMDAAGNIYVADVNNSRIRKIAAGRHHHHDRRQGRSGLQRRWRKRHRRGAEFPAQRRRRFQRHGVHRRHRQSRDSHVDAGFPTISSNGVTNAASFAHAHFARSAGQHLRYRVRHQHLPGRRRVQLAHQQPGGHQRESEWRGGASLLCLAGTDQFPGAVGHAHDGHGQRRGPGQRRHQQYRRGGGGNRCSRPVLPRAALRSYRTLPTTH